MEAKLDRSRPTEKFQAKALGFLSIEEANLFGYEPMEPDASGNYGEDKKSGLGFQLEEMAAADWNEAINTGNEYKEPDAPYWFNFLGRTCIHFLGRIISPVVSKDHGVLYVKAITSQVSLSTFDFTAGLESDHLRNFLEHHFEIDRITPLSVVFSAPSLEGNEDLLKEGKETLTHQAETLLRHPFRVHVHCRPVSPIVNSSQLLPNQKSLVPIPSPPVYSATKVSDFIEWNGLYCRSQPEESIAKELERRGLNFMVNPGGRFTTNEGRKTREPDFLVFLGDGKSAILEVDGEAFHQSAAKDHDRDRVFRRLGVPVERFTAKQCTNDPSAVVSEFLTLVTP